MGPRPFGRGDEGADGEHDGADGGLQWGRDLSVAEIQRISPDENRLGMLQWGRDLSVAEIRA